jgi:hypothetical protein
MNQPRIMGMVLCHKNVGDPWVRGVSVLSDLFEHQTNVSGFILY